LSLPIYRVADSLASASLGFGAAILAVAFEGRKIWIVDARCGDGKRYVVRTDEKLTGVFGT
jgi:hypothetical protein